eukprot:2879360-Amphidinium_carterae.1
MVAPGEGRGSTYRKPRVPDSSRNSPWPSCCSVPMCAQGGIAGTFDVRTDSIHTSDVLDAIYTCEWGLSACDVNCIDPE